MSGDFQFGLGEILSRGFSSRIVGFYPFGIYLGIIQSGGCLKGKLGLSFCLGMDFAQGFCPGSFSCLFSKRTIWVFDLHGSLSGMDFAVGDICRGWES